MMLQKKSLIDINSIRLFSLAKLTTLALIVTSQPPPFLTCISPWNACIHRWGTACMHGHRNCRIEMARRRFFTQCELKLSRLWVSSSDGGNETLCRVYAKYWCPVNLYERPYKRRGLGKRIEGVASDGMPWKKNPPPWKKVSTAWKKVPTAACFYGAPPSQK